MLRIWGVTRCQNYWIPTLFCPIWSSKGILWTNICVVTAVFHYWGHLKYKDLLCFYLVFFSFMFTSLFISVFDLITTVICFTTYKDYIKSYRAFKRLRNFYFIKISKLTSVWQDFITVIINYAGVETCILLRTPGCVLHAVCLVRCRYAFLICISI